MNFKLCFALPFFSERQLDDYRCNTDGRNANIDERTDMLATMMAMYPSTETKKIAEEFGVGEQLIKELAIQFCIKKSKEVRGKINSSNAKKIPIEMVKDNKVVAVYGSIKDASVETGISYSSIYAHMYRSKNPQKNFVGKDFYLRPKED